ncbi:hypothetical protein XENTR_v10006468 [Xenopus tropicalis]|nr:hypothetical protein XENTR_v10006468 [Xenopus tropicalis]
MSLAVYLTSPTVSVLTLSSLPIERKILQEPSHFCFPFKLLPVPSVLFASLTQIRKFCSSSLYLPMYFYASKTNLKNIGATLILSFVHDLDVIDQCYCYISWHLKLFYCLKDTCCVHTS